MLLSALKAEVDQGNIVLNCDTDSLKIVEIKPPLFFQDNKELGAWKFEGYFTHFGHINKHKKYFLIDDTISQKKKSVKMATSGLPEDFLFSWDDGESIDEIITRMKTIFNENNRILIKGGKKLKQKNHFYQLVMHDTDLKFAKFESKKLNPTHLIDKRKIITL